MREEEKIKAGILFDPSDPELKAIKRKTHNLNLDYNSTYEEDIEKKAMDDLDDLNEILTAFFGDVPGFKC